MLELLKNGMQQNKLKPQAMSEVSAGCQRLPPLPPVLNGGAALTEIDTRASPLLILSDALTEAKLHLTQRQQVLKQVEVVDAGIEKFTHIKGALESAQYVTHLKTVLSLSLLRYTPTYLLAHMCLLPLIYPLNSQDAKGVCLWHAECHCWLKVCSSVRDSHTFATLQPACTYRSYSLSLFLSLSHTYTHAHTRIPPFYLTEMWTRLEIS